MRKTEIREEIAFWFLHELNKSERARKAGAVMRGIDHKRPFVLSIANGLDHVEVLQVSDATDVRGLDDLIERAESNRDGLWRYYDGMTEFHFVCYDQVIESFKRLRERCIGQ